MKKTAILLLAAIILSASNFLFAQRNIKHIRFDGISLNTSGNNFIKKLNKKGWQTTQKITSDGSEATTLDGKINGIKVSATILSDTATVSQILIYTDSDQTQLRTRYDVIKSWIEEQYGYAAVEDIEDSEKNLSSYWGSLRNGERHLLKNHICLTTVENQYVLATLNNKENSLDATMNSIGDAVEGFGNKVSRAGKKAIDRGRKVKDKITRSSQQVGEDAEDFAGKVSKKTKATAKNISKKAKRIANSAAETAKKAWKSVKN